jgi:hypothetical protein
MKFAAYGWLVCFACAPLACESVVSSVVLEGGDFAGAKADAHCDRRFVTDGGQAAAFCQEVKATVATSEFTDDCRAKHHATAGSGLCPRANVIAGCRILKHNDDDSLVWDWYYDVSSLDAGVPGPDGGPVFDTVARAVPDVERMCADPKRYELGAEFARP